MITVLNIRGDEFGAPHPCPDGDELADVGGDEAPHDGRVPQEGVGGEHLQVELLVHHCNRDGMEGVPWNKNSNEDRSFAAPQTFNCSTTFQKMLLVLLLQSWRWWGMRKVPLSFVLLKSMPTLLAESESEYSIALESMLHQG